MADAVTTKVLENGPKNYVVRFTNESDGTGESGVTKVDISTLTGPDVNVAPTSLAIKEIEGSVWGMNYLTILADATTDETLAVLNGEVYRMFDPPLNPDTTATGFTGDVLFTTDGASDGGGYDLTITFHKKQ